MGLGGSTKAHPPTAPSPHTDTWGRSAVRVPRHLAGPSAPQRHRGGSKRGVRGRDGALGPQQRLQPLLGKSCSGGPAWQGRSRQQLPSLRPPGAAALPSAATHECRHARAGAAAAPAAPPARRSAPPAAGKRVVTQGKRQGCDYPKRRGASLSPRLDRSGTNVTLPHIPRPTAAQPARVRTRAQQLPAPSEQRRRWGRESRPDRRHVPALCHSCVRRARCPARSGPPSSTCPTAQPR